MDKFQVTALKDLFDRLATDSDRDRVRIYRNAHSLADDQYSPALLQLMKKAVSKRIEDELSMLTESASHRAARMEIVEDIAANVADGDAETVNLVINKLSDSSKGKFIA